MKQTPDADEMFLDHVGWFVPAMDDASSAFEALGFTLTPFAVHAAADPATGVPRPLGTANRLVMLEQGYLEILTPTGAVQAPVVDHMQACLARHVGVHLLALSIADTDAARTRLVDAGFSVQPTVPLRRMLEAEAGGEVEVAFSVLRPAFNTFDEGRVQLLTHHTPEHVWQPRYTAHANGITSLKAAHLVSATPAVTREKLTRFTARDMAGAQLTLDRGALYLRDDSDHATHAMFGQTPDGAQAPYIAAITLGARDLTGTRQALLDRGVNLALDEPARLLIAAPDACGVALEIVPDA
ncbi:MAG: VOC family protein [Pseudomonadota bacterium]